MTIKNVINVFLFQNYNTLFKLQNGSSTPEKKNRSRPPSYTGGDSPIALRSRSSTCDSLHLGSSLNSINRQMPPPPPPQSRKPGKNRLLSFCLSFSFCERCTKRILYFATQTLFASMTV